MKANSSFISAGAASVSYNSRTDIVDKTLAHFLLKYKKPLKAFKYVSSGIYEYGEKVKLFLKLESGRLHAKYKGDSGPHI